MPNSSTFSSGSSPNILYNHNLPHLFNDLLVNHLPYLHVTTSMISSAFSSPVHCLSNLPPPRPSLRPPKPPPLTSSSSTIFAASSLTSSTGATLTECPLEKLRPLYDTASSCASSMTSKTSPRTSSATSSLVADQPSDKLWVLALVLATAGVWPLEKLRQRKRK